MKLWHTLAVLLIATTACDDDTARPQDASIMDVGPDSEVDADDTDAHDPDANVEVCTTEVVNLSRGWSGFERGFGATRIPLSRFCGRACPTLATFEARYLCEAADDGGPDDRDAGGVADAQLTRTEGCGHVSYQNARDEWPRYYNFSLQTGELVGAASLDDVGTCDETVTCCDAAYVAGQIMQTCPSAIIQRCTGGLN